MESMNAYVSTCSSGTLKEGEEGGTEFRFISPLTSRSTWTGPTTT